MKLLSFVFLFCSIFCVWNFGYCAECQFTPIIDLYSSIPENFNKVNNLIKVEKHSSALAKGKIVIIEGTVRDANCVPLVGAFVGIWQLNSAWIDNNLIGDDFFDSDTETKIAGYDSMFAGNGSCNTDNLGRYSFVTVVPGVNSQAVLPKINFYIKHYDFIPVTTSMYFGEFLATDVDGAPIIADYMVEQLSSDLKKSLIAKKISSKGGIDRYRFDICLAGSNIYRSQ